MNNNVLIPRSTFESIINLLESVDFARLPNCYDYHNLLIELKLKKKKIDIRDAYSNIIYAKDDDDRFDARIEYLNHKRCLDIVDVDDLFP